MEEGRTTPRPSLAGLLKRALCSGPAEADPLQRAVIFALFYQDSVMEGGISAATISFICPSK